MDGIVIDRNLEDISANDLIAEIKSRTPDLPIIVICSPGEGDCPLADYVVESFEPNKLLEILRSLKPRENQLIERANEDLSRKKLE